MTPREAWNESKVMPNISLTTVKRYLIESNLYGRVPAKKPMLNTWQIQKRYKWCKTYLGFSAVDWSKVIFCIENIPVLVPLSGVQKTVDFNQGMY